MSPSRVYQPRDTGPRRIDSGLLYLADFTIYPNGYLNTIPALDGVWRLRWNTAIPEDAQILAGKLRVVDGAGGAGNMMGVVCDAVAPRGEQVVQARVLRRNSENSAYVGARYTEGAGNQQYSVTIEDTDGTGGGKCYLSRHVWGTSDSASGAVLVGPVNSPGAVPKRVKIHVRDSFQRAWINGTLIGSAANAANDGKLGRPAIFINTPTIPGGYVEVDEFIVCTKNTVEVRNVPTGGVLQCGAAVSPVASGGVCVLDLAGTAFPAVVEVVVGGIVVANIGDVYGGDTWRLT